MKLSVVLSTYNDEKYLDQCIQAILNQSFRDFEFFIINDASPDNSDAIIRKYKKQDSRISYIKNTENKGPVINANSCMKYLHGNYYYIASSDDWICQDFFENAIKYLEKYNAQVCCLDVTFYYPEKEKYVNLKAVPDVYKPRFFNKMETRSLMKKIDFLVPTAATILCTDAFVKQGSFSEKLATYADMLTYNFIAGNEGFVYVPKQGVKVRQFQEHKEKYNPDRKEKIKRGFEAFDYFLENPAKFELFCNTLKLPKCINIKFYIYLLLPRYWSLAPRLMWCKCQLISRKIKSIW